MDRSLDPGCGGRLVAWRLVRRGETGAGRWRPGKQLAAADRPPGAGRPHQESWTVYPPGCSLGRAIQIPMRVHIDGAYAEYGYVPAAELVRAPSTSRSSRSTWWPAPSRHPPSGDAPRSGAAR